VAEAEAGFFSFSVGEWVKLESKIPGKANRRYSLILGHLRFGILLARRPSILRHQVSKVFSHSILTISFIFVNNSYMSDSPFCADGYALNSGTTGRELDLMPESSDRWV
jgi:hypothetical protein